MLCHPRRTSGFIALFVPARSLQRHYAKLESRRKGGCGLQVHILQQPTLHHPPVEIFQFLKCTLHTSMHGLQRVSQLCKGNKRSSFDWLLVKSAVITPTTAQMPSSKTSNERKLHPCAQLDALCVQLAPGTKIGPLNILKHFLHLSKHIVTLNKLQS